MTLDEMFFLIETIAPDENGCKIWPKSVNSSGYPIMWPPKRKSEKTVHRLVLARKLGREIQPGMFACHTCDVPKCVNEDHLWEGTPAQNSADMVRKNRQPKGETNGFFGKQHDAKTKELLSELAKNRPHAPHEKSTRLKIAAAHAGKESPLKGRTVGPYSEDRRNAISGGQRKAKERIAELTLDELHDIQYSDESVNRLSIKHKLSPSAVTRLRKSRDQFKRPNRDMHPAGEL
jgi:hypothetical protein